MPILVPLSDFKAKGNLAITIGTFDGVHIGHQQILKRLIQEAQKRDLASSLMTFWPHPRLVVAGYDKNFKLLNTLEEKAETLQDLGIDHMIVAPFTRDFSEQHPEEYVREILVKKLKGKLITIGYDHRFGKDRAGSIHFLKKVAPEYGFEIIEIPQQEIDNVTVSSTKIRNALDEGKVEMAATLLGRPYSLTGTVVRGDSRGKKIGFPTANISVAEEFKLVPKIGVYAVKAEWRGGIYQGMLNIGFKPTFNTLPQENSIEAHLFNFDLDIYGERVTIYFIKKLREEMAFPGADALVEQLKKDKQEALSVLKKMRSVGY